VARSELQCLILRGPMGQLCGYVRVPRDHPLHGKHYRRRCVWRSLNVHGGITFAGCLRNRAMKRGHWFGFDCAHAFDLVPGMVDLRKNIPALDAVYEQLGGRPAEVYRDVNYVRAECTELAAQLARKAASR
jgi:hypothetical protein